MKKQNYGNRAKSSAVVPEDLFDEPNVEDPKDPDMIRAEVKYTIEKVRGKYQIGSLPSPDPEHVASTREEILKLARAYATGQKGAWSKMVTANIGLVVSFALRFTNRGVSLHDLIQEGCFGLMTAVEKFDHRRGNAFSTYGRWWINRSFRNAIDWQTGPVRIPANKRALQRRLTNCSIELRNTLGRKPTIEEISKKFGKSVSYIAELFDTRGKEAFSLDENLPSNDGSDTTHSEIFPDANVVRPDTILCAKEEIEESIAHIGELVSALNGCRAIKNDRDKVIFRHYYGLDGSIRSHNTYKTIGIQYKVTKERVRQILKKAWRKIYCCRPKIELDESKLLLLYRRIKVLEEGVGRRILICEVLPNVGTNGFFFSDAVAIRIKTQPRRDKNPAGWDPPSFMTKKRSKKRSR